ncbi:MAG: aspartate/glutamate racemase family protein [Leptospira sp.]|nr:aspartate/glutamate racemase family protein [Leptospira sp.]
MLNGKHSIGLFDSGLGGLSVLKTLWSMTTGCHFIYFADLENGPYGNLTKEEVIQISKSAFDFLLEKNSDAILFACNSATSAAANFLRETHKVPIFGMEPAVKPASSDNPGKAIAVFATKLTLKEEKFKSLLEQLEKNNEYIPVPCEGLAKLIDDGKWEEAWDYLDSKIQSILEKTNIIVLGCTHYIFLKDKIRKKYPQILIYDGNFGTSSHIKNSLKLFGEGNNTLDIFLNTLDSKYVRITEDIVSEFAKSYTISLNQTMGNQINV